MMKQPLPPPTPHQYSRNDLFAAVHPNTQNEDGDTTANTMMIRQRRRDAICDTVRSPKFNKARARRLFAGLIPLLRNVAEEESYIPTDDDDDEGNITIQELEVMVVESTQSILFLRCCAFLVEAYLDDILDKQRPVGGAHHHNTNWTLSTKHSQ